MTEWTTGATGPTGPGGERRPLEPHADRLLPADPSVRAVARELYDHVRALPIVSPHGHVDPAILRHDRPWRDPAELFVTPDHYVTRLLHADGVPLERLGVGEGPLDEAAARRVWHELCARWGVLAGTPARLWLEDGLAGVFDIDVTPSAATADSIYDRIAERLAQPGYRPRALYERFGISVLATTDDPCDPLEHHAALAADRTWSGRVIPTFRPDRYLEPGRSDFAALLARLAEAADVDTGSHRGHVEALAARRRFFVSHGATSADHSHADARTDPLEPAEAERIHRAALAGTATPSEADALRRHLVGEMARLSCDDGLVMTLHPGVRRNHHRPTFDRFGPDAGHDIPTRVEFTDALRPLLDRYGTTPGFHLVVFTLDETTWGRELAPLAGFYPSLYVGAPWWFLDAPSAIRRFRSVVTEVIGLSRTSGFVDDTRAFCSIPARHDMARRLEAGFLADLVADHRLERTEALALAEDVVVGQPTRVFKLADR